MRRTLLATTAAASLLAFGAVAQQATDPATSSPPAVVPAETPTAPAAGANEMGTTASDATTPMTPDSSQTAADPAVPGAAPMDPAGTAAGPVLSPVESATISADALIGSTIQTTNGDNIASVEDVILDPQGAPESVVAQFGGFLGFGSDKVLLTMDEIEVMQDEAGNLVVQTALTPESLEGRPDYQAEN